MALMTLVEAIRSALELEMERDPRVIVLGLDVGKLGGVFRATDGLQNRFGSNRVVNTPISEAAIIGVSLGLAISGYIPVAEIQFLGFSHQAFHQLGPQLGRFLFRSRGRYNIPVTVRAPYGGGLKMPEFHADAIEAQLANNPGLKIVCPSNPYDAKGLLLSAIRDPDPVIYMEPMRLYRAGRAEVPEGDYTVPIGISKRIREGTDVTIVAWSSAVELAKRAALELESRGVSTLILDLRSLVPMDVAGLVSAVEQTGRCIVLQEAPLTAGFGAEVAATVQQAAFFSLESPVIRIGSPNVPYPPGTLESYYLPSVEKVVAAAQRMIAA